MLYNERVFFEKLTNSNDNNNNLRAINSTLLNHEKIIFNHPIYYGVRQKIRLSKFFTDILNLTVYLFTHTNVHSNE